MAAPGRPGFQSSQTWLPYVSGSSADPGKGPKWLWFNDFKLHVVHFFERPEFLVATRGQAVQASSSSRLWLIFVFGGFRCPRKRPQTHGPT